MPSPLHLNAVAFISPQNHPILVRTFQKGQELKYHYVAHTSLDVIEERSQLPPSFLYVYFVRSLATPNPRFFYS